jgi:hypothetical protein
MASERGPSIGVILLTCNNANVVKEKIQNSIHKAAFGFINTQVKLKTFMEFLRHRISPRSVSILYGLFMALARMMANLLPTQAAQKGHPTRPQAS